MSTTTLEEIPKCWEMSQGYAKLRAAVDEDLGNDWHDYEGKLRWVLDRATHYAEKTGLRDIDILDAWEAKRNYWYMNYYQEANQPRIESEHVYVFDTLEAYRQAVGKAGFRCLSCHGVSSDPYECDTQQKRQDGSVCDWKAYGLFGTLGEGVYVFVKEELTGQTIFRPVAWETAEISHRDTENTEI